MVKTLWVGEEIFKSSESNCCLETDSFFFCNRLTLYSYYMNYCEMVDVLNIWMDCGVGYVELLLNHYY